MAALPARFLHLETCQAGYSLVMITSMSNPIPNEPHTGKTTVYCCGATVGSQKQHSRDLREIYKMRRILEFITFYQNALHVSRVHCATNNSNKNPRKACIVRCPDSEFLCGKFSTARLEVLPNLRHEEFFQMSTMVNLGVGFQFKSL